MYHNDLGVYPGNLLYITPNFGFYTEKLHLIILPPMH